MKSPLKTLAISLLLIVSISYFVVPALMSVNVVPKEYFDVFCFISLGLTIHALAFLVYSELPN